MSSCDSVWFFHCQCCWNVISSGVEVELQKPIPSGFQVVKWSQPPRSTTHLASEKGNRVLEGFSQSTDDLVKLIVLTVAIDMTQWWCCIRLKVGSGKVWYFGSCGREEKGGKVAATESEIWTVDSQEIIVAKSQKYGRIWMAFCQHVSQEFLGI